MHTQTRCLSPLLLAIGGVFAMQLAYADDTTSDTPAMPSTDIVPTVVLDGDEIIVSRRTAQSLFGQAKPSDVIIKQETLKKNSATLGDALAGELGVHSNHYGGGASAPIVRGQEGKRLKVLQNSTDVLDMANLSPDHAVMVDTLLAKQVEIVRGASTLLYSAGNVAGQINVVDDVIKTSVPSVATGEVSARYGSANDEKLVSASVSAGIGEHIAITAQGLVRRAGDYQTPKHQQYHFDSEKALKAHIAAPDNLASLESEYQHWLANRHQTPYFRYRPVGERHFIRSESDYQTKKQTYQNAIVTPQTLDYLPESWSESDALALGISWVGERGYVGASISHRHDEYGLPAHNAMYEGCGAYVILPSSERKKPYLMSYPQLMDETDVNYLNPRADCLQAASFDSSGNHTHSSTESHEHGAPWIDLTNRRYDIKAAVYQPMAGVDKLGVSVAHADYQHQEKEGTRISSDFRNKATTARIELTQAPTERLSGIWGVQYLTADNSALAPSVYKGRQMLGTNSTDNWAIFGLQQYQLGDVTLEASARAASQRIKMHYDTDKIASVMQPNPISERCAKNAVCSATVAAANAERASNLANALDNTKPNEQHAFSYAIGAKWQVTPEYRLSISASHQERLPTAQELYTHGMHLATSSFEVGNKDLTKEKSNNIELALGYQGERLDYQLSAYYYDFDNYIYLQTLNESLGNSTVIAPYSLKINRYSQSGAKFHGFEGKIGYQLNDTYHASVFGDVISGRLVDLPDAVVAYDRTTGEKTYEPQANRPTPRLPPMRLGTRLKAEFGEQWTGELEYYRVFDQDKLSKFEHKTAGHDMLNVGLTYQKPMAYGDVDVFIKADNLLNQKVYAHATYLPYIPQMGRSISFGATYRF